MKSVLLLIAVFFTANSFSEEYVRTGLTTINHVGAFHSSSASGDVLIKTEVVKTGCERGYLLLKTTPGIDGLNNALSIALSAFHTDSDVSIDAYSGREWAGSTNTGYCHIEGIHLAK